MAEIRGGLKLIQGAEDFSTITSDGLKGALSVVIGHAIDGLGAEGVGIVAGALIGSISMETGPGAIAAAALGIGAAELAYTLLPTSEIADSLAAAIVNVAGSTPASPPLVVI